MTSTVAPPDARARLGELRGRLNVLGDRGLFLVVAGPLFALYLLTASWTFPLVNDASTNSMAAWSMGTHGSVHLQDHEELADYYGWFAWIVPAGDSVASKYPPGASLVAAPLYSIWPQDPGQVTYKPEDIPERFRTEDQQALTILLPPVGPAAIAAALTTAAAIGLLAVAFRRVGGSGSMAVGAAYVAGLGTSAWPVASGQLWQHGPAMAWIALALVLSDRRLVGSGLAYGMAILTRPPLAIIAAVSGVVSSVKARALRPAVLIGAGAALGLAIFLAYNWWLFGSPTVSAGYGNAFEQKFSSGLGSEYLRFLFLALFAVDHGILVWSPFLLVLIPGLRAGWRSAPPWARGAAVGGILYLLVQYKANRSSGGTFLGYRYPLEALTAAAPVLFLSYTAWLRKQPRLVRLFGVATVAAVAVNALAAVGIGVL